MSGAGRGAGAGSAISRSVPAPARRFPLPVLRALVVMFFSLNGGCTTSSDSYLFSAHMVQHLLLAFVVAPLLIMGTPGDMLRPLLAVPRRACRCALDHRADAMFRDLQHRRRRLASSAALQLRAGAPSRRTSCST